MNSLSAALLTRLQQAELFAFDLDGTLVDSVGDLALALNRGLKDLGWPQVSQDQVRHWVGQGSLRLAHQCVQAHYQSLDGSDHAASLPLEADEVQRLHQAFLHHYQQVNGHTTQLLPGALASVQHLKKCGKKLALITNKPSAYLPTLLALFELDTQFDLLLGGDSLLQRKPDPAPLLYAAHHLGCSPHTSVMIGDSRHDIHAARAAGFISLGLPAGYNHGEDLSLSQPDAMLGSLNDLLLIESAVDRIG
ncbi:phosphoglycolate phosphatase [Marinospirillum sp. MEB164]|uniref:phosphoglycolate phosphatase n=1 Tax=Marinospirillum alkalitolerans TaxID=3123374 RepID=A0ABW8PX67_9GAMM